jgi:hypothetical protein
MGDYASSKIIVATLVTLAGCSSSSSSNSTKTPPEQCADVAQALCTSAVMCFPDAGTVTSCYDSVTVELSCNAVTGVTASYNGCLSACQTASCADLGSSNQLSSPPAGTPRPLLNFG